MKQIYTWRCQVGMSQLQLHSFLNVCLIKNKAKLNEFIDQSQVSGGCEVMQWGEASYYYPTCDLQTNDAMSDELELGSFCESVS